MTLEIPRHPDDRMLYSKELKHKEGRTFREFLTYMKLRELADNPEPDARLMIVYEGAGPFRRVLASNITGAEIRKMLALAIASSPISTDLAVGQIWKSNDKNEERYVRVEDLRPGKDFIECRRVHADGTDWTKARVLYPLRKMFPHPTQKGYTLFKGV